MYTYAYLSLSLYIYIYDIHVTLRDEMICNDM